MIIQDVSVALANFLQSQAATVTPCTAACGGVVRHAYALYQWQCTLKHRVDDAPGAYKALGAKLCYIVQLRIARATLMTAVNERWPGDTKDDKFRRTVVCSYLRQALAQVSARILLSV